MAHIIEHNSVSGAVSWQLPEFSNGQAPVMAMPTATLTPALEPGGPSDSEQVAADKQAVIEAARTEAEHQFAEQWQAKIAAADALLARLQNPVKRVESELSEVLMQALSAAIEKICFIEANNHPHYLSSLVNQLIELAAEEKKYRIHLSTEDYATWLALTNDKNQQAPTSEPSGPQAEDSAVTQDADTPDNLTHQDKTATLSSKSSSADPSTQTNAQHNWPVEQDASLKTGEVKLHSEDLNIDASLPVRIQSLLNDVVKLNDA